MTKRKSKALTIVTTPTPTTEHDAVLNHAAGINQSWQKAVSSIIETGQRLNVAKDELPRGDFGKLFDPLIGNVTFSERTAQQLMQIARHAVLANPSYSSVLPPHWRTLAILSRASDDQLQQWLADKTVTAETEQSEALALLNPPEPEPQVEPFTPDKEPEYTSLIQQRQLYEGACEAEPDDALEPEAPEPELEPDDAPEPEPEATNAPAPRKRRGTTPITTPEPLTLALEEVVRLSVSCNWAKAIDEVGFEVVRGLNDELTEQLKQYSDGAAADHSKYH